MWEHICLRILLIQLIMIMIQLCLLKNEEDRNFLFPLQSQKEMYELVTKLNLLGLFLQGAIPNRISWNVMLVLTFESVQNSRLLLVFSATVSNLIVHGHMLSSVSTSHAFFSWSNKHATHICTSRVISLTPRIELSINNSPSSSHILIWCVIFASLWLYKCIQVWEF